MYLVREARLEDAAAIAAIYNAGIAERTATFETAPRSAGDLARRLMETDSYPVVVAIGDGGDVCGWAGLSAYRSRACYAGIAEFSVYVAAESRGRGVGKALIEALVAAAGRAGHWKLVSRVFVENTGSRALCRSSGFREVGLYEKHGFLEGRWRDVVIVERLIDENVTPAGIRIRRAWRADWPAIASLLSKAGLPLDGAEQHLATFVVAVRLDQIVGAAGLECYPGDAGLLRSVVVNPHERGTGTGRLLVERVLDRAARDGVRRVVLLTTTAPLFFEHLGFERVDRTAAPASLGASAEFTGACPDSAIVMMRTIG